MNELVKEIEEAESYLHGSLLRAQGPSGTPTIGVDAAHKLLSTLQRAREALELRRLELKVVCAMAHKFNINTYGTDKQCKEAFKKLWTAFDELEAYENDRKGSVETDTLDRG